MAIQELDLKIRHRPGCSNANADAFVRAPLESAGENQDDDVTGVIANLGAQDVDLPTLQRQDVELEPFIKFLETGILPADGRTARLVATTASQYTIEEGVLYRVEFDGTLRLIPPRDSRETLFHSGVFGAHLGDAKVFSELRRSYWWYGMRSDISRWSRGCLVCATRQAGSAIRAPLTPIPVVGPFDRIGVDIIQFPKSQRGNQYAVVFVDYLTKWPEVFPVSDQSAATVARLLVDSRHRVPAEFLSDRGRAFLSGLMKEVEGLLGFHKVNTSAYHPQTDGLVERFNRTLTAMLAKTAERGGRDWDLRLPYVLFAYRASEQQSTRESPFYLLYGRDPRLPSEAMLGPTKGRRSVPLRGYGQQLTKIMSEAWELARHSAGRAQNRQKQLYDKQQRPPTFGVGDRAKPAEKTGEAQKLARPYHGPFRVVEINTNTAKIRRVDRPQEEPIVAGC